MDYHKNIHDIFKSNIGFYNFLMKKYNTIPIIQYPNDINNKDVLCKLFQINSNYWTNLLFQINSNISPWCNQKGSQFADTKIFFYQFYIWSFYNESKISDDIFSLLISSLPFVIHKFYHIRNIIQNCANCNNKNIIISVTDYFCKDHINNKSQLLIFYDFIFTRYKNYINDSDTNIDINDLNMIDFFSNNTTNSHNF